MAKKEEISELENEQKKEAAKITADAEVDAGIKSKYKAIKKIINTDEKGNDHVLYLKEPSRLAVGVALATIEKNVTEGCEIIFNDAVIREVSDIEYFQQNSVFYGLLIELQTLIRVKKSTSMTL